MTNRIRRALGKSIAWRIRAEIRALVPSEIEHLCERIDKLEQRIALLSLALEDEFTKNDKRL